MIPGLQVKNAGEDRCEDASNHQAFASEQTSSIQFRIEAAHRLLQTQRLAAGPVTCLCRMVGRLTVQQKRRQGQRRCEIPSFQVEVCELVKTIDVVLHDMSREGVVGMERTKIEDRGDVPWLAMSIPALLDDALSGLADVGHVVRFENDQRLGLVALLLQDHAPDIDGDLVCLGQGLRQQGVGSGIALGLLTLRDAIDQAMDVDDCGNVSTVRAAHEDPHVQPRPDRQCSKADCWLERSCTPPSLYRTRAGA